MRVRQLRSSYRRFGGFWAVAASALVFALLITVSTTQAATNFDSGGGDAWWFNFLNWSKGEGSADFGNGTDPPNFLPPAQDIGLGFVDPTPTDAQINEGAFLNAEGVVYDPANDPYYNDATYMSQFTWPTNSAPTGGFGPESIYRLYVGRNVTSDINPSLHNLLTIKSGYLTISSTTIIGRSGAAGNLGEVVQTGGEVDMPLVDLDIGQCEVPGEHGNGRWDYRGGVLDVAYVGAAGIRLSAGSTTKGPGGFGTFAVHNPGEAAGGHVRTYELRVANYTGLDDGITDEYDPNGVTTGVGIVEFHYENGNTRPIQVEENLVINNGEVDVEIAPTPDDGESRVVSSRLDLVLDEAPTIDESGVPMPLGLIDVDAGNIYSGVIVGVGDIDGNGIPGQPTDQVFSNIDNTGVYSEGSIVEAMFGASTYRWTISYTGNINWSDMDNSVLDDTVGIMHNGVYTGIEGTASGTDVVLIGLDSVIVEGLYGDYNDDGVIDAADYTVWRDALAAGATTLTNDSTPGTVDESDYTYWKAHFGETTPPGAGALVVGAVPEPSTLVLTIFLAVLWMGRGLASRR